MIAIIPAHTGEALEQVITLSQEYVSWMLDEIRQHYPQLDIHEFVSEHDYDDVRHKFPGQHVPPHGCLLIARLDDAVCGCVALAPLTETICEVRTLFVRPAFRGMGVGRKLAEASLVEARRLGYSMARLDTLGFMTSALNLYRALGFYDIEPYLDVSASLKQHICFLECHLSE